MDDLVMSWFGRAAKVDHGRQVSGQGECERAVRAGRIKPAARSREAEWARAIVPTQSTHPLGSQRMVAEAVDPKTLSCNTLAHSTPSLSQFCVI